VSFINLEPIAQEDYRPPKSAKHDPKFKDEHYEIYSACKMSWPPVFHSAPELHLEGMHERQAELVFFMHKQFPPEYKGNILMSRGVENLNSVEFFDALPTLGRLVAWPRLKNAWSPTVPTITSSALIVMRVAPFGESAKLVIRALTGKEVFALAGWTSEMFEADTPSSIVDDSELLTSLAGNMFSAYAIGPALMVALALLGATPSVFPKKGEKEATAEDCDGSDVSENFSD
jgi:hypothetical protein